MKKFIFLFLALTILSCSSDDNSSNNNTPDEVTCGQAISLVEQKQADYESNPNSLTCSSYKAALQQQKSICGDPGNALQDVIDALVCDAN